MHDRARLRKQGTDRLPGEVQTMRSAYFATACWLGFTVTTLGVSRGRAEERVVSPLLCGANTMFDWAGLYYGTLPAAAPGSRREEFIRLLKEAQIRTLRYPGGTWADAKYLPGNEQLMRTVLGVRSIPEGDPDKVTHLWQFLDFCKAADIVPVYQLNMLLYCDGEKVYQLAPAGSTESLLPPPPAVVLDPGKRAAAATAVTRLVETVRDKGFNVRHWELGNEEYGYPRLAAADYADLAVRFIQAIRAADADAMIWVTLGSNHCSDADRKTIIPWSRELLQRLRDAGLTQDRNLGFTLHYVWPGYFIDFHTAMLKEFGFRPRLAVTEFHMAGPGDYSDLSPRFGYALELAPYLIGIALTPSVEMLDIHELTSQNFGILHYNQRSYGPPGMQTWDPALGYQLMPSARVYGLFGQLVGGHIVPLDSRDNTRLAVELGEERRVFLVNRSVNPLTVQWDREVVGAQTTRFTCQTLVPDTQPAAAAGEGGVSAQALGRGAQAGDPLRADRAARADQRGEIGAQGLTLTVPPYSVNLVCCLPPAAP
jgi:hypothetical protein